MQKPQKKSSKNRKVRVTDLKARKDPKGGFNPQPDPPGRR
jgi:hypothetical protein